MKIRTLHLLLGGIILHHLYPVLLNTSTIHGVRMPDKQIWTVVLLVPLVILSYRMLQDKAETRESMILYMAIALSVGGSILHVFGMTTQVMAYSLLLFLTSALTIFSLTSQTNSKIRLLTAIYTFEIMLFIARTFSLESLLFIFAVLVELWIVVGIIYYNYSLGITFSELFSIILATFIGFQVGMFITQFEVPMLIIGTVFDQTLSVGQFAFTEVFDPKFFLALHMAEIFNIAFIFILFRKSELSLGIIMLGVDMTYPPILGLRAIALLLFIRGHNEDKAELANDGQNDEQLDDPKEELVVDTDEVK